MNKKKFPAVQTFPEKCSGCRLCELVCSTIKNSGTTNPQKSRIRIQIEHRDNQNTPKVCLQCAEPPCLEACAFGAISPKGFGGIPIVDLEICTGCEACIQACPYSAIFLDRERKIALKCDLCAGDPECVKNCLQGALTFEERNPT